jgi:hypothetical protein
MSLDKWRAKFSTPLPGPDSIEPVQVSLIEDDVADAHLSSSTENPTREAYIEELERLLASPWTEKKSRRYDGCPVTMKFAFVLSSASRPAFRLARSFLPLPCQKTLHNHDGELIKQVQDQLLDPQKLDARISAFIVVNDLSRSGPAFPPRGLNILWSFMASPWTGSTSVCHFMPSKETQDKLLLKYERLFLRFVSAWRDAALSPNLFARMATLDITSFVILFSTNGILISRKVGWERLWSRFAGGLHSRSEIFCISGNFSATESRTILLR